MEKELNEEIKKKFNEKMTKELNEEMEKNFNEEIKKKFLKDLGLSEDCDISSTNGLMKFLCKKLPAKNKADMIKSLIYDIPAEILDAEETYEAIGYLVGAKK